MYYTESVIMSEGKEFVLRNPKPEEAAAVLDYLRIVSGETDYMIRLPEEVTMSVADEESFLQSAVDDPKKTMIGIFLKDRMIGNIGINPIGAQFKLCHRASFGIAVVREYWGHGFGKLLLQEGIKAARDMGYEQLELGVYGSNERARKLYLSFGFAECGRVPKAFRLPNGTYENEILMTMAL